MNRYFDKADNFSSNSRIFEAYYNNAANGAGSSFQRRESLFSALGAKLNAKKIARALRVAKSVVFTLGLLSMLGIAGAVESGSLGIGAGLLLSAAVFGIEYFVLRSHRA